MLFKVIIREWKRILTLPTHYIVLLVMPPLLFFFFALIYQNQPKDLPFGVWDQDNTALSRQLTQMMENAPNIHIVEQYHSLSAIKEAIQEGKIDGAVHFPKKMTANIKSNHPVNVILYTNSAAIVPGKLIYKDAAKVIVMGGLGVVRQKLMKKGVPKEKAMALVQPIELRTFPLYNGNYNYQQYLSPGLITVILQMAIIMISILLVNYEWKTNSMQELIETAGGSAWRIIIGKTLAHLGIAWVDFLLIAGVIFPYFGLYHPGTTGTFFVMFTLLALACIGFGVLVSVLFKDVMFASDVALFYTSPAFVFSGYTFPRWAMPWYDQVYAHLMPYTPFLQSFFKTYFMGLSLEYCLKEIGILLLFIAITFPIAILVFQHKIKKIKKDALVS